MPSRLRVLVIDGDPLVAGLLGMLLEKDGYEVLRASSNEEGIEAARVNWPDAIILETTLPGEDGLETCRRLRCMTDAVILLVGPGARTEAAVRGLQLGADDCLGKPYSYEVLASRLKACLNQRGRQNGTGLTRVREVGLVLDANRRRVFIRDGRCVSLSPREFELLRFLVENHDRVISADDILIRVWGPEYAGDRDLVKQFIYRLRCKLEADPDRPRSIVTVRGSGYAFEPSTRPSIRRLLAGGAGQATPRAPLPHIGWAAPVVPPPQEAFPSIPLSSVSSASRRRRNARARPSMRTVRGLPMGAAVLALVVGLLVAAGTVEASSAALPGDRLYPVKIAMEGLRYGLTIDESERLSMHLRYARERIEEVSALVEAGRLEGLSGTLAAFEGEMLAASWAVAHRSSSGAEEASSLRASLEAESRSHDDVLRGLLASAPDVARPGLEHALILLNTGSGTSHALFIGLETFGLSEPPRPVLPAENASISVGGPASEETAQAQPPVEIGLPPASTLGPTQVPYILWITGNERPGTAASTTQVPILHAGGGGMEILPTSSPTPTSGFPQSHAR